MTRQRRTLEQFRCTALNAWHSRASCAQQWVRHNLPPPHLSQRELDELRGKPCAGCLIGEAHREGEQPEGLETRTIDLDPGDQPLTLQQRHVADRDYTAPTRELTHPETGESATVAEWAQRLGMSRKALYKRLKRYDAGTLTEDELFAPPQDTAKAAGAARASNPPPARQEARRSRRRRPRKPHAIPPPPSAQAPERPASLAAPETGSAMVPQADRLVPTRDVTMTEVIEALGHRPTLLTRADGTVIWALERDTKAEP